MLKILSNLKISIIVILINHCLFYLTQSIKQINHFDYSIDDINERFIVSFDHIQFDENDDIRREKKKRSSNTNENTNFELTSLIDISTFNECFVFVENMLNVVVDVINFQIDNKTIVKNIKKKKTNVKNYLQHEIFFLNNVNFNVIFFESKNFVKSKSLQNDDSHFMFVNKNQM